MNDASACASSRSGRATGCRTSRGEVPTAVKVELIERLADAGLPAVEATAFVSPKWMPQMADHTEVLRAHPAQAGRLLSGADAEPEGLRGGARRRRDRGGDLRRGVGSVLEEEHQLLDRRIAGALQARCRGSASSTASRCAATSPACSAAPTRARSQPRARGRRRGGAATRWAATRSRSATPSAPARPARRKAMIEACAQRVPIEKLAGHYHDTYGQALANIYASLELGVAHLRRLGRRARRLPLRRRARPATSPPRTWCTC